MIVGQSGTGLTADMFTDYNSREDIINVSVAGNLNRTSQQFYQIDTII